MFRMADQEEHSNGMLQSDEQQLADAKSELDELEKKVLAADNKRSLLLLEKMDTDEAKKKAQQDTTDLIEAEKQLEASHNKEMQCLQDKIDNITKVNHKLVKELQDLEEQLRTKKAETDNIQQRFKIKAEIPEKRMKFTQVAHEDEQEEGDNLDIKAVFTIMQRPSVMLKAGQALITFEEEKVAEQILQLSKCSVTFDKTKIDVKPCTLSLEPSVKFEVHIMVSKRIIRFSDVPPVLSEERMRDRLELSFSKPSHGGGEVEKLEYNTKTETGKITFLKTGVAENLTLKGKFFVNADKELEVKVHPMYNFLLKKFQTFCGVPKRTVLLNGIKDITDEEDLQDHLEIYFQKPSNYGGEVESIKYAGKTTRAFFDEDLSEAEAH